MFDSYLSEGIALKANVFLLFIALFSNLTFAQNTVVVIPFGSDGKSISEACGWVAGPGCSLGGVAGSACTTNATCPANRLVISGGCSGFTSVAIGRSTPILSSPPNQGWQCYYSRIQTVGINNTIRARAFCCDE